ncbi:MAG: hypothetical protein LIO85_03425 [Rikenellaceae bacterium]|nr:hypothetical protein [Rikenellaceae bacterium]
MKRFYIFVSAVVLPLLGSCSKNLDSDKPHIEHSMRIMFVDEQGKNLFNSDNFTVDAIKIVYYDSEGNEHNFYNGNWFGVNGYTVNWFEKTFTIYFTLPEEGGITTTETYMRFFSDDPDVFTAEYDVKEGKNPDEAYGGGTVRLKTVKYNGHLVWDGASQSDTPVHIIKQLPLETDRK